MKTRSMLLLFALIALAGCATDAEHPNPGEKRETLATHETRSKFLGIEDHVCRGLTARCPDRCGHSGQLARFEVLEYLNFESFSQYGKKQERFDVLIKDNMGNPKTEAIFIQAIERLSPGDTVLLSWNHDYVTRNGASGPERPITRLGKEMRQIAYK